MCFNSTEEVKIIAALRAGLDLALEIAPDTRDTLNQVSDLVAADFRDFLSTRPGLIADPRFDDEAPARIALMLARYGKAWQKATAKQVLKPTPAAEVSFERVLDRVRL